MHVSRGKDWVARMYARIYCIYHACMPAPSSSIMPGFCGRDNGHKGALMPVVTALERHLSTVVLAFSNQVLQIGAGSRRGTAAAARRSNAASGAARRARGPPCSPDEGDGHASIPARNPHAHIVEWAVPTGRALSNCQQLSLGGRAQVQARRRYGQLLWGAA